MSSITEKIIRFTLGILLLLVALIAFVGSYYGMAGEKNAFTAWLQGSPFHDYFVPSFLILVFVGGPAFIASVTLFSNHRIARSFSFISGVIVLVWLLMQIGIMRHVSWMQACIAVIAILILFLTWLLPESDFT